MPRARKPQLDDIQSTGYGDRELLLAQAADTPQADFVSPDEVPNVSDPTARPSEPVTAGLPMGPGDTPMQAGIEAPNPIRQTLQALVLANPNNDVMRLIDMLDAMGR